jgi:hypothetical protein
VLLLVLLFLVDDCSRLVCCQKFEFYGSATVHVVYGSGLVVEQFVLRCGQSLDCFAPITAPRLALFVARRSAAAPPLDDAAVAVDDDESVVNLSSSRLLLESYESDRDAIVALAQLCDDSAVVFVLSHLERTDADVGEIFDASRAQLPQDSTATVTNNNDLACADEIGRVVTSAFAVRKNDAQLVAYDIDNCRFCSLSFQYSTTLSRLITRCRRAPNGRRCSSG